MLTGCTAASTDPQVVGAPPAPEPSPLATTSVAAPLAPTASSGTAATPTPSPDTVSAAPERVSTSPAAPANATALDFTARRLSGGTMDGVQLAGGDVVIWMWAPWCPQCNREAPHVARALRDFGDRVRFIGIAGHDRDEAHRAFVADHALDGMVQLVDDDGSLWARYGIGYQPAWVFIDEDGDTRVVAGGLYDDLEANLQALVDG